MPLDNSLPRHNEAASTFIGLQTQWSAMGGPNMKKAFSEVALRLAQARGEVVKDLIIELVKKELEAESLEILRAEDPNAPFQYAYLRTLTKRLVEAARKANVSGDLEPLVKLVR